ncbi:MAG: ATP-binding cassette domain-containing protein, partial [Clostridiaceae bacterium]|nr:ATP-binding cassette domain-containing protein [Clostridiaceae bacterium]
LREIGIREPLYLTALRYAGVDITESIKPQHVESLMLDQASTQDPAAADTENGPKPLTNAARLQAWDISLPPTQPLELDNVLLEADSLGFYYDQDLTQRKVVNDISFKIYEGEAVSLVGRNGAGKSTLAKLICGFETPQQGKLLYDGRDMSGDSIRERAERIGYIMQNPNQMISLPMIFDEVALGLRVRGIEEEEVRARVEDTLRICGLHPFRNWPVSALSFGQKKRLTIASILVLRPKMIILDEPTAGQDFYHYTQIMEFLRQLNQEMGLSMLMITHDMHLMLEYTTRAIVIADSVKLADDTPANVLTDDNLIEASSLKRTSLYDLAIRCGLDDPRGFVQRFIYYDREVRAGD